MNPTSDLRPTPINVPDSVLKDLRTRLQQTRWATDLDNEDWSYGVPTSTLKELVSYWIDGYDWRAAEAEINQFDNYKVQVDGVPVHFIYEKARAERSIPIILSHGWPWTFWHWSKVIGPLTDPAAYGRPDDIAFDVVVPCLPGFGFSTPLTKPDMNFWKIADIWHELMTNTLGYSTYAAGGADYGALVSAQLGHKYATSLYGVHLAHDLPLPMFQGDRPWVLTDGAEIPPEIFTALRDPILEFERTYSAHVAVHMLEAQTVTHALTDSPVGLLAWLLQRWRKWSDQSADFDKVFPRDHILTSATIYWINEAIGSSIRMYPNANRYPWRPSHDRTPAVEAPVGFTFLAGDSYPPGVTAATREAAFEHGPTAALFNTAFVNAHEDGGHFVPWENPDAVVSDMRTFFGSLR